MALLFIAYERLVNGILNEDTLATYHEQGRRLGRLMYEGRWLEPQSLMLRESIQKWVGLDDLGHGHPAPAPRRGLHDPRHRRARTSSYGPEKLSMERVGDAAFGPTDRIGQLTMRNLDIADSRSRLEQYAGLGLIGGATGASGRPRHRRRGRRDHRARRALRRRARAARRRGGRGIRVRVVRLRHRLTRVV